MGPPTRTWPGSRGRRSARWPGTTPRMRPAPQRESEMTTTTARWGRATSDEADLYYERRGDGPPLLLITGGGGDAGYYSALAGILAGDFTVLTYDRRGNSRSRLPRGPVTITMAGQSADAIAVLRENGFSRAHIFGNSG